jgi:hypothetical protein
MSEIDPQEFGRLQAQVEALLRADAEKTDLLRDAVRERHRHACCRWPRPRAAGSVLMLLGGGAAGLGSIVTLALARLKGLM